MGGQISQNKHQCNTCSSCNWKFFLKLTSLGLVMLIIADACEFHLLYYLAAISSGVLGVMSFYYMLKSLGEEFD